MLAPSHTRPSPLKQFHFGVPYYPEHWDHDPRHDLERIADAGMTMVRLAEFAWALLEPEEGRHDFDLFDRTLDACQELGLTAMLCTPTATPPRWMTHRHPDMLRVDGMGRVQTHGSRQHASHMHAGFREHSRRITRVMAERWKDHPAVSSWQTDNEFHCHFSEDHSEAARAAFARWCEAKHGTLEALNKAWGTIFWSGTYTAWDQIVTPRPGAPTHMNPAHTLDYHRFLSDAVIAFQKDQVDVLREVNPAWWITHNGTFAHLDYRKLAADLDVLGFDNYPMFHAAAHRSADISYRLDRTRAWSGNFVVPEQQAGAGGQCDYMLDAPAPGEQRQHAWRAVSRGADAILFFRWRSCLFGAEQHWLGLIDHDGVGRRRFEEAKRFGAEARALEGELLGTSVRVDAAVAGADQDVEDAHAANTLGMPSPSKAGEAVHRHWFDRGVAVGVVHPADDLSGLSVYVLPHWQLWDDAWTAPLTEWVRAGGHLVVGALTGVRDWDNNMRTATAPGPLAELCGVRVEESMRVNDKQERPVRFTLPGGGDALGTQWAEVLEPVDAEVLAAWSGSWYDGRVAATRRSFGSGTVTYVGTWLTPEVCGLLLPPVEPVVAGLPAGVEAAVRGPLTFLLNNNQAAVTVNAPGTDRLTGASGASLTLEPFGVAILS